MANIIKLDANQSLDFDREMVEQAYDRWAPVYDLVFGGVFSKGRKAAIQATNKIGGRVLEVGVGTGISLPQYASHLRIFGTDISEAMLQKAKKRVDGLGLKNVEGLAVMDAEKLEFPDDSFDVVMAQYVVTAVPNPEVALDEFARVLRPGGELIILTRVSADAGMRRFIEQRLQPVVRPLGFRTAEFAWSRYAKGLAGVHDLAPGRSLLLRAEGVRPRQPGDPRAQGRDQGRLQSAAQGGADVDLGAVACGADAR